MSDIRTRALSVAQSVPLAEDSTPREVARALQEPLLETLGQAQAEGIAHADRRFASRVGAWESGGATPDRGPRLVTPWPDIFGSLAVASAMASAAGAGRLTGGTALNSLPVVAPTVVVSFAIAFVLLAVGVVFARRERAALLAEYEDSRAVTREALLWAAVAFAVVATIAMIVRLATDEVFPLAIIATVVSGIGLVVTVILAIGARRIARRSASGGKLIHRARGTTRGSQRNEAISASEDARDEAAAALESVSPAAREDISGAYADAVAEVASRKVLPARTLKRLAPQDWIAARYDVEV